MIRYFKVYGYLEILIKKKNVFQIISNIFSGIDVFKVDLVKIVNQREHQMILKF